MRALFDILAGRERELTDAEWRELLAVADRTQSTPLLRGHDGVPEWVAAEVENRVVKVAARRPMLIETYKHTARALNEAGIDFVLLKGASHERGFGIDPVTRVQNDIDLWVQPSQIGAAKGALLSAGFVRHPGPELSYNHAAPLVKPNSWAWRCDYFDPAMPVAVELHHTLWNERWERVRAPELAKFWDRRVAEDGIPMLARSDRLGFAALHLLRHVLRGSVRPGQAYELSRMLDHVQDDEGFWLERECTHTVEVRRLQTIASTMVTAWLGRVAPTAVAREWARIGPEIAAWFEQYGWSPVDNLAVPNKDALRLHLTLAASGWDRAVLMGRRLVPLRIPSKAEASGRSYAGFVLSRVRYHAVALTRMLGSPRTASSSASQSSD